MDYFSLPENFGSQRTLVDVDAQLAHARRKVLDSERELLRKSRSKKPRPPTTREPDCPPRSTKDLHLDHDHPHASPGAEAASNHTSHDQKPPSPYHLDPDSDADSDDDSDSDDEDIDPSIEYDQFPISHELVLRPHSKPLTSLSTDVRGARLATASVDGAVVLHDFAAMTPTSAHAFRRVDPSVGNQNAPVMSASFDPVNPGGPIIVATTDPRPVILSRDGEVLSSFARGDMYLRDLRLVAGHVAEVTTASWHPNESGVVLTASADGTVRVWDSTNPRKSTYVVMLAGPHRRPGLDSSDQNPQGSIKAGRIRIDTAKWIPETTSSQFVVLSADGVLSAYSPASTSRRPTWRVPEAHLPGTLRGVAISPEGRLIATRGGRGDDRVRLWDVRKAAKPLKTQTVPAPESLSGGSVAPIEFSHSGSHLIVAGTDGNLVCLTTGSLAPCVRTQVAPSSDIQISALAWPARLNQILVGLTDGTVRVLFSPSLSASDAGAPQVFRKAPKRRHVDDDPENTIDLARNAVDPDAIVLPTSIVRHKRDRPGAGGRRDRGTDSANLTRPYLPPQTPFTRSQPDDEHIRTRVATQADLRDEDPRVALLRYHDLAQKDPIFTRAWQRTQPNPVFADPNDFEDEEENAGTQPQSGAESWKKHKPD